MQFLTRCNFAEVESYGFIDIDRVLDYTRIDLPSVLTQAKPAHVQEFSLDHFTKRRRRFMLNECNATTNVKGDWR